MKDQTKTKVIMYLLSSTGDILTWMHRVTDNFRKYVDNMDGWVKEINKRMGEIEPEIHMIRDNTDNVQHNYELIYELKDQIEELKQEVNALKLVQIISLKRQKILKEHDSQISADKKTV